VGFGTELLFIVALGLMVLGPKRLHILLAYVAWVKLNLPRRAGASSFSSRHNSKGRLRTPNTMTNPCCPERKVAQSPMSRIQSLGERAGSLWRNSKLDQKCAF
jgi:hypothetical protein